MDKMIFSKIPAIMADVPTIGKNRKNQAQGYQFRGIDDMYNELHEIFVRHKVFFTSKVLNSEREERQTKSGGTMIYSTIDVEFTFYAEDGSSIISVMKGEAMDSGDKASNKAMSTALKYALMQLLMIPTEDLKDTEYESPEVKPKSNVVDVSTAIKQMENAQTIEQMKAVWANYKQLQSNVAFMAAKDTKKAKIEGKSEPIAA